MFIFLFCKFNHYYVLIVIKLNVDILLFNDGMIQLKCFLLIISQQDGLFIFICIKCSIYSKKLYPGYGIFIVIYGYLLNEVTFMF
jgi:hypothetical protein